MSLLFFSAMFLILFGERLRLRDWGWGVGHRASGIGEWGVGIGHWAPGIQL